MNFYNLKGFFVINNIQYNYQHEFTGDLPQNRGKQYISLLEYCLNATNHVPHYCYHKQLSIAGNCRMCLVELKKSPKPIISCAMNAQSTLKINAEIFTNSPLVKKTRENINLSTRKRRDLNPQYSCLISSQNQILNHVKFK